ncbi:MAG: hypothetical protein GQ564_17300 [Bacteroidales bacterium]|nr:hypothetical protein [Bacteroidales bacterium]
MITTIDEITNEQLPQMKNKVINYLYEKTEDESRIASISEQSFDKVIAHLFQEVAFAKGYKIALPFARASKIVENVWNDISDGISSVFRNDID